MIPLSPGRSDRERFDLPYVHSVYFNGRAQKLNIQQARFKEEGFASTGISALSPSAVEQHCQSVQCAPKTFSDYIRLPLWQSSSSSDIKPLDFHSVCIKYIKPDTSNLHLTCPVWDSSIVLAKYFEKWPDLVRGKRCLELGAGCGLVGKNIIIIIIMCEYRSHSVPMESIECHWNVHEQGIKKD